MSEKFEFSKFEEGERLPRSQEEMPESADQKVVRSHIEALKEKILQDGKMRYQEYHETFSSALLKENLPRLEEAKIYISDIPPEACQRIESFIDTGEDPQLEEILVRRKVDIAELLRSSDKDTAIKKIYLVMRRDESFNEAVEKQKQLGIKYCGIEADKDLCDLPEILPKLFTKGLLDKCLISRISYFPDIVFLRIRGEGWYLPIEKYEEWIRRIPEVAEFKCRAESVGIWNADPPIKRLGEKFFQKFISFPINLYSFHGENLEQFEYLRDIPDHLKMRAYKIGTVAHEVGHNIYNFLIDLSAKRKWEKLIDETGNLTLYSRKHATGILGEKMNYGEEFAEAIRLMTTAPLYLKEHFPRVYEFIKNTFPEIQPLELREH